MNEANRLGDGTYDWANPGFNDTESEILSRAYQRISPLVGQAARAAERRRDVETKFRDANQGQSEFSPPAGFGVAVGQALSQTAMPTRYKRGGLAGGGKSGDVTSPASRVLRDMTNRVRYDPLGHVYGTTSIGGAMGRTLPFVGLGSSFLDYVEALRFYSDLEKYELEM